MVRQPNKVRICHVVVRGVLDGSQRSMLDILRRLSPHRYDRHVICQSEGPLTDALRESGIPFHLVPTLGQPIRPPRDWLALRHIRRICLKQRFDLLHTHNSKSGLLGRIAAHQSGVPHIVHHVRGFSFHEFSGRAKRLLFSQIEKYAGRYCDRVIFVNHEERNMCIENRWLPPEKCQTIYNGVDLSLFDPAENDDLRIRFRCEHNAAADEPIILVSGRLENQKQPLILPEIAAALDGLAPHAKWRILVAGEGTLKDRLQLGVQKHNVEHRVELIGWHAQSHKLFLGCDIVLLPSLWEGLPRVLIEAQAAGQPVVASEIKGNREVVTEATGTLCEPTNPQAYARALAELVTNPLLRKRRGEAARQRAVQLFDVRNTFSAIEQLYESLLRSRSTGRRQRAA